MQRPLPSPSAYVAEEVTCSSHILTKLSLLAAGGEQQLDFLIQELLREANTLWLQSSLSSRGVGG
jgi:uncharacterized protein YicC (UPF0701 family)